MTARSAADISTCATRIDDFGAKRAAYADNATDARATMGVRAASRVSTRSLVSKSSIDAHAPT